MRRYRVLLPLLVGTEDGNYGQGETFEKEFSAEDELANVQSGLLEIVPSKYRVVAEDSIVYGTPTGGEFEAAILIENEAALIEGGHIERVEEHAEPKRAKPAKKKKKEAKG